MPSSAEAVTTGKKNVFGLGAAFDAPQRQKTTTVYHTEKDPTPLIALASDDEVVSLENDLGLLFDSMEADFEC